MALNEKRRPPFTTFAQRFTLITRSANSDLGASAPRPGPPCRMCEPWPRTTSNLLEFQTAGARAVGERLDAPVIAIAAAIECDLENALLLRALGEQLAHRPADREPALLLRAQRLPARRGHQGRAAQVVDDLGIDVLATPEHRQARALDAALDTLADAEAANRAPFVLVVLSAHVADPAVLPALRRMYSPSYLMPLPL